MNLNSFSLHTFKKRGSLFSVEYTMSLILATAKIHNDDNVHEQQIENDNRSSLTAFIGSGGEEDDGADKNRCIQNIYDIVTGTSLREDDHGLNTNLKNKSNTVDQVDGFTFYSKRDNKLYFSNFVSVLEGNHDNGMRSALGQRVPPTNTAERKTRISFEVHPSVLYGDIFGEEEDSGGE